ncbi:putative isoflavone reductase family protein CipA [Dactylonectria estremocensis]|uniref:Isoflavone reductase family protein CipA n=1 Tax=Dactylonectria estremocensis TaxID=1079267 RepID=A0A9P9EWJ5_9HYPO|nr:putative isoflavone reductase family protein CipA [Dactylonectria estremocensis]
MAARTIENVALAGATGNVGANVLLGLLKQRKFNITVLSRTKTDFPVGVVVKVVDFSSVDALTKALIGQHAVVDATFPTDDTPQRLIDASVAAGVYRYVPSDFGCDPALPGVHDLPVFARKQAAWKHVKMATASSELTWTIIACGVFLDWNLSTTYMNINLKDKKISLFDDGTNVIPWTTLSSVGKATAAALLVPEETQNRVVYVHDILKSQKQVAELAKAALGPEGWEETTVDIRKQFNDAMADFKSGKLSPMVFGTMIQYAASTPALMTKWPRDDNSLVGLNGMSDTEVRDLIKELVGHDDV